MKQNLITRTILVLCLVVFASIGITSANNNISHSTTLFNSATDPEQVKANEASAIEIMRLFHSVQVTYQQREGKGQFGSAKDLFMVAYIDGNLANASGCPKLEETTYKAICPGTGEPMHGYKFQVAFTKAENGKEGTFAAVGFPAVTIGNNATGTRSFYVDQTGIIRYSNDPNVIANAKSPVLD